MKAVPTASKQKMEVTLNILCYRVRQTFVHTDQASTDVANLVRWNSYHITSVI